MSGREQLYGSRPWIWGRLIGSLAALTGVIGLLTLAAPAQAAFPGANGKIAFVSERDGNAEIYTMNADGAGQTRLTNTPAFDAQPAWSPDGTKIAFSSARDGSLGEIYTMNADGSGQTRLTTVGSSRSPAWSPDGKRITFARFEGSHPTISPLWMINADETGLTRFGPPGTQTNSGPSWSPDGKKIAFTGAYGFFNAPADVYTVNSDGSELTQLTLSQCVPLDPPQPGPGVCDESLDPNWSPDGSLIAFSRATGIFKMSADGSGVAQIPGPQDSREPAWSPDGTKIVFDRQASPACCMTRDISVMNADGSGLTQLTANSSFNSSPDWQPIVGPRRIDYKNSAQFCKAERDFLGDSSFRQEYGGGANAYGKCVAENAAR